MGTGALRSPDASGPCSSPSASTETGRPPSRRFAELGELARTAGVEVLDSVLQVRREPDPRYLLGQGQAARSSILRSMQLVADVMVFDRDLSPSQSRHIAEETSLKVLDRTQLILDIFAQRAQSADGKLQVELAQLKYLLPRLSQRDDSLSRLAGGIGGRGPGETKLEIDRRRVRDRIAHLERRIEQLSSERQVRRGRRQRRELPVISIVGYTNAGKSTLLNALTHSTCWRRTSSSRRWTPPVDASASPRSARSSSPTPWASSATCPRTFWPPFARRSKSWTTRTSSCTWSTRPTRHGMPR